MGTRCRHGTRTLVKCSLSLETICSHPAMIPRFWCYAMTRHRHHYHNKRPHDDNQGLSQDLENGFQNGTCKNFRTLFFKGTSNIISYIYKHVFTSRNKAKMSTYCAIGIILRWQNFNYMLKIDILRNSCQHFLEGVLKAGFWGFGCPDDTQMPCWLRLWRCDTEHNHKRPHDDNPTNHCLQCFLAAGTLRIIIKQISPTTQYWKGAASYSRQYMLEVKPMMIIWPSLSAREREG